MVRSAAKSEGFSLQRSWFHRRDIGYGGVGRSLYIDSIPITMAADGNTINGSALSDQSLTNV
jgi:hypothetical protein